MSKQRKRSRWRRKMLDLLPRAAMDEFQLNTGVVRSTDETKLDGSPGHGHRILINQAYDNAWADTVAIGFRTNADGDHSGVWHVGHYSPARCRLIAMELLRRAEQMEHEQPDSKHIDKIRTAR